MNKIAFLPEELILKAGTQGYLLADDLLAAILELEKNIAGLDDLFIQLINRGIKIYSNAQEAKEKHTTRQPADEVEIKVDLFDLSDIAADNILGLYLKEIAWVPLLTATEEFALAKQIEKGNQAQRVLEEASEQNAEKAELLRAQAEGGFKFSTYATWWIRQAVTRGLSDQSRIIRVPVHMSDRIRKLRQVATELEQNLGRKPTSEELGAEMDLELAKVEWILRVSWQPLSIEQPVGKEKDAELGHFIEDEDALPPPAAADAQQLREKLEQALSTLTPREAKILRLRYGLPNGQLLICQKHSGIHAGAGLSEIIWVKYAFCLNKGVTSSKLFGCSGGLI